MAADHNSALFIIKYLILLLLWTRACGSWSRGL